MLSRLVEQINHRFVFSKFEKQTE